MSNGWTRVSPGRWKGPNGQIVNSAQDPGKGSGTATANTPSGGTGGSSDILAQLKAAESAYTKSPNTGTLEALKAIQQQVATAGIDPSNPSGASKEDKAISDLLGPGAEAASLLSNKLFGEGSLGRMDFVGPEGRGIVDKFREVNVRYGTGEPSAQVQDVINRYRSGLEGYNSAEMNAMREQAMQGIDSQYATESRTLAKKRAGANVGGAASLGLERQLNSDRTAARGNLERDLFVKNADEKYKRLGDYANLIGNVEETGYQRAMGSLQNYSNAYNAVRADDRDTQAYNNQQLGNELAGRYGAYFGALNLGLQNRAQAEDFALNKEYLDIAKKKYGSSGKKSTTNPTSSTTSTNPYYQEAINLIRQS